MSRKSKFALLIEHESEKIYLAVAALHAAHKRTWFTLDEVAEFIREQQRICERTKGARGMLFALWPRELFKDGWSDYRLATGLRELTSRRLLDHRVVGGINEVGYLPPELHGPHQLRNPDEVDPINAAFNNRGDNLEGVSCP